jgi:hypothetical protein
MIGNSPKTARYLSQTFFFARTTQFRTIELTGSIIPTPRKTSIISPISFIDRLINKNQLGQPFTFIDRQRESYALPSPSIRMAGCRGTRSCIHASEKNGETTLNGGLTLWWTVVAAVRYQRHLPSPTRESESFRWTHNASTVARDTVKEMALSWMR